MISLDSVTLKIDKSEVVYYNKDRFLKSTTCDNGVILKDIEYLKSSFRPVGVKKVEIREDHLIFEFSAKLLQENYKDLINKNTLEMLIKNINNSGIVIFKSDMPTRAEILKCDVTSNLYVRGKPSGYVNDLELFRVNEKYSVQSYKRSESITFIRRVKTYHERQIYYDKEAELLTAKNKKLVEKINLNDFKNCLRVEANITSLDQIRNGFGVPSRKFAEVLQSNCNPNLALFERITKDKDSKEKVAQIELIFEKLEKYGAFYLAEKTLGREAIIKACNYDMALVKECIRRYVKGNISKYMREYRRLAREMQNITELQMANIREIEILLKAI